jgi:hypothetical protein
MGHFGVESYATSLIPLKFGWKKYRLGNKGEEVGETNCFSFEFGWYVNSLGHTIEERCENSFIVYGI